MKEKNKNANGGITLIALIITIVIMLVLVGVSINIAINAGLFNSAGKASKEYKTAQEKEQNILSQITVNGNPISDYVPLQQIEAGERATFNSLYGSVVVPAGFTVSKIPSEQNVEDGLVIYDIPEGEMVDWNNTDSVQTKYNQFVYVPIGNFYVGRYEVGCEEERTDTTVDLNTPLLKRDLFPYNYVTYEEAKNLCEDMYPKLNIGLCSVEELQDIDEFMSNKTGLNIIAENPYGSRGTKLYLPLGNFANKEFTVNRGKVAVWNSTSELVYSPYYPETPYTVGTSRIYFEVSETRAYKKEQDKSILLSTGAVDQFSINNIFDLYGNLSEYVDINDNQGFGFFNSTYWWCSDGFAVCSYPGAYSERLKYIGMGFRPVIHLD